MFTFPVALFHLQMALQRFDMALVRPKKVFPPFIRSVKFASSVSTTEKQLPKSSYDAVIIGAGHNGLVAAAYLQKAGIRTCVLESRHVIGGAAVTEEIIPGFKFSRASYVLSLLRPNIFEELELQKHGLKVFLRDPSSYTPLHKSYWRKNIPKSLTLHMDPEETRKEIAGFSSKDAQAYGEYEELMKRIISAVDPMLDQSPPDLKTLTSGTFKEKLSALRTLKPLKQAVSNLGKDLPAFFDFLCSPVDKILNQWFESEPLKATLATDGVIGAMLSPSSVGSGYVLLHHVMGGVNGVRGAWGYVEGGMGSVSNVIANAAIAHGAEIYTCQTVKHIKIKDGKAEGVVLADGREITASAVLSNATPNVTFIDLMNQDNLPDDFVKKIKSIDYTSPVTKINIAVKEIPNFTVNPNRRPNEVMPHHRATIHLNCENMQMVTDAYLDGIQGKLTRKPMIEMVIPSSLDSTLAPKGCHVCLLFTQYTPYHLADGQNWNQQTKKEYFDIVTNCIEEYAPGFRDSIIGYEVLTPPDLESIFGLTGGNIFHGSMSLDQLFFSRPTSLHVSAKTPIKKLYLCGSGAHPGGGVMGSAGRLAALVASKEFRLK